MRATKNGILHNAGLSQSLQICFFKMLIRQKVPSSLEAVEADETLTLLLLFLLLFAAMIELFPAKLLGGTFGGTGST